MIRSIKHRGLRRLFEEDDPRGVGGNMRQRVINILGVLDAATSLKEMNIPGYRLHALSGELRGHWSVRVTGNWRIVFRFADGDVQDVDLVDYH